MAILSSLFLQLIDELTETEVYLQSWLVHKNKEAVASSVQTLQIS